MQNQFALDLNYILEVQIKKIFTVNCEWGSWNIEVCSKTCGDGTRRKTRTKTVVEKYNGVCQGDSAMNEDCKEKICPGE